MSIPILWQDPFSSKKRYKLISNYFSSFDEDQKLALKGQGINVEFSKPIFDYAIFLKVLDLSWLGFTISEYLERLNPTLSDRGPSVNFIINLLFKFFIESGATLHKLDLFFSYFTEIKPEIFNSLEQNTQFFSRIQDLSLEIESYLRIENTATLFEILIKNTTKISDLKFEGIYPSHEPQLFHTLIPLESQKNTLQEVIIENCYYNAEFEVLNNCKNLEILRMRGYHPKLSDILNCKISILEIVDETGFEIDASTIVQILEQSGELLQRLTIHYFKILNESLLLEAIKSSCPNITYLSISKIGFSTQLLEIIGNLQKLQFLTLQCIVDIPEELKIRVKQFAEILPLTLQYLDLVYNRWLVPYADILLNNCNAPLNKLFIYDLGNENNIKALIEFCIRNRTLNYVSVFYDWKEKNKLIKKKLEAYTAFGSFNIVVNC
ncbi:hypothetical protein C2G38_2241946 [Gigaspora rosea]|uniref:F-box domain-containing protein n=1 Tax=Gigaspora rosea TaxID=44941 RepID=A0A397VQ17_9GLOM|nr:hypothetical protein C2G38_2241946 [Gigaspora rosea]